MADEQRPNPNAPHPAIDEASIARLVATFYGRAREDAVIGPVFAAAVADWDEHIATITAFWSGAMLRTGRYGGRPLAPHLALGLEEAHFDRWLMLFERTCREIFPDPAAEAFIQRARRIADSFEMAIAGQHGAIKAPRHSV
jgi:hemoglobin